jgi:hypothetical protein
MCNRQENKGEGVPIWREAAAGVQTVDCPQRGGTGVPEGHRTQPGGTVTCKNPINREGKITTNMQTRKQEGLMRVQTALGNGADV